MKHGEQGSIYLQRGYMIYGNVQENTLKGIKILPHAKFDWHLNKRRVCFCECPNCIGKGTHAIISCRNSCNMSPSFDTSDVSTNPEMTSVCHCSCSFCTSPITMHVHKVLDCFSFCESQKDF